MFIPIFLVFSKVAYDLICQPYTCFNLKIKCVSANAGATLRANRNQMTNLPKRASSWLLISTAFALVFQGFEKPVRRNGQGACNDAIVYRNAAAGDIVEAIDCRFQRSTHYIYMYCLLTVIRGPAWSTHATHFKISHPWCVQPHVARNLCNTLMKSCNWYNMYSY